jgi:CheY-like chemotaxis protein
MKLTALVVSQDDSSIQLLQAALGELGIQHEITRSSAQAVEMLVDRRHTAIVLDFELQGAHQVAKIVSIASPEKRPALFALVGGTNFGIGQPPDVSFVLHKPFSLEQALRPLRGWQIFVGDRRRSPRRKLEALVYLQLGMAALPALILDLSEHGLALQAPEPLPPVQNVPLRFVLPGTTHMVEATGEVIWADDLGRVGMVFSNLTPAARYNLKAWFNESGRGTGVGARSQPALSFGG